MLEVARDVTATAAFRHQPVFEPEKVQALLDRFPSMQEAERKAYDPVVYFVLSVGILQARWGLT
jgi:hypothetical protein